MGNLQLFNTYPFLEATQSFLKDSSNRLLPTRSQSADISRVFNREFYYTPIHVIQEIRPDILVKDSDYDENEKDLSKRTYIVGSDVVKQNGGEVKTISLVDGYSTTKIIQKIKR